MASGCVLGKLHSWGEGPDLSEEGVGMFIFFGSGGPFLRFVAP